MKSDIDKCHLIMCANNTQEIQVEKCLIKTSNFEKYLTFDNDVNHLCNKANNAIEALARATRSMNIGKRKLLMTFFFHFVI